MKCGAWAGRSSGFVNPVSKSKDRCANFFYYELYESLSRAFEVNFKSTGREKDSYWDDEESAIGNLFNS